MKMIHNVTHFGVDKTLYIIKQCQPELNATRKEVSRIVESCFQCKSIDPAPVRWEKGEISVKDNWSRLACDITHFRGNAFLSLVDYDPRSRFAIWRLLANETVQEISDTIVGFLRERGPPEQLLVDVFKSQIFYCL